MQLEKKCICQRECVQVTLRLVSELQHHIPDFHAIKQDKQPAICRGNLSKSLYRNDLFGRIFIFSRIIDKYQQHLTLVKSQREKQNAVEVKARGLSITGNLGKKHQDQRAVQPGHGLLLAMCTKRSTFCTSVQSSFSTHHCCFGVCVNR